MLSLPWKWRKLVTISEPARTPRLRVLQYNILADHYCKMSDFYGVDYEWKTRLTKIVSHSLCCKPDVICLEEVCTLFVTFLMTGWSLGGHQGGIQCSWILRPLCKEGTEQAWWCCHIVEWAVSPSHIFLTRQSGSAETGEVSSWRRLYVGPRYKRPSSVGIRAEFWCWKDQGLHFHFIVLTLSVSWQPPI